MATGESSGRTVSHIVWARGQRNLKPQPIGKSVGEGISPSIGTVIGAAKLPNVTQPGVSRTIALLEQRIGYKLFERRGRRLVPTPEGEALYREIEPLYGGLNRIAQIAQDIRFQRAGALRIETLPALAQWVVPRGVTRFLSSRPNVSIFIQNLPSRQIAEMVSTRQLDVGIIELPLSHPAIVIDPLEPTPSAAVIPARHRLAGKRSISLRDPDGERMILLSHHSAVRHQIDDAFSSLCVTPNVVIEAANSLMACALAAAGAGITLVGHWTAMPFCQPWSGCSSCQGVPTFPVCDHFPRISATPSACRRVCQRTP